MDPSYVASAENKTIFYVAFYCINQSFGDAVGGVFYVAGFDTVVTTADWFSGKNRSLNK